MNRYSAKSSFIHYINLTDPNGREVTIPASELIAYDQQLGFTRLLLVGRRVVEVKEGTDQIDRLIRTAAARVFASWQIPLLTRKAVMG